MLSSLGGDVLPPDWEATTDPSSGNTYYYNTKTNAVSWERPRGALWLLGGGFGRSSCVASCTGTVLSSLHSCHRALTLAPYPRSP